MLAVPRLLLCVAALAVAVPAAARPSDAANGVFLVAKPGLPDPNFRHSVVLVTHGPNDSTLGVILNRPTRLKLSQLLPRGIPAGNYRDRVFFGGPVMLQAIVALFHARSAPPAPALHILKNLYLTTQREELRALLAGKGRRYRIYLGLSSWAPGQLEDEIGHHGWYVLPADEATVFRGDTRGLWKELVERANAEQVHLTR
ncbi:MAG TPA: YqgE/AlgH family protein [Burkholderiales bacterium]|nr:YqgE/AlgH family protein [Burkholderiales bacterium]